MSTQAEAVRAALEKILGSESFAHSQRHREFLRYIVEEALAGRGDRIKGYTVAVEVFRRPEDFDALNDPYVRVEAGRLRRRLAEYYVSEGADDSVRIELKKGSYEPEFSSVESAVPQPVSGASPALARRPLSKFGIPLVAAALLAVAAIAFYLNGKTPRGRESVTPATAGEALTIKVHDFQNLGEPGFDFLAMSLTEQVLVLLSQYAPNWGSIQVFRKEDLAGAAGVRMNRYELTGTVLENRNSVRVTARIVDTQTSEQLWSYVLDESLDRLTAFAIEDRAAADIVNIIREPNGPIAAAQIARVLERPVSELFRSDCHLLFQNALRTLARPNQESTKACLERFAAIGELDAPGWAVLALVRYWEFEDGFDLRDGDTPSIQSAYDAVQRALDLNGNDILPHLAFAYVNIGRGMPDRAIASTERFMSLNPPPSTAVQGESLRLRLGAAENTLAFEARVAGAYRSFPDVFIGPAFFELRRGDYDAAMRWAERIDAPDYSIAQVLWAALSAYNGQTERAARHVSMLLKMHPAFPRYGRALIGRWSDDPEIFDRLVTGLALAGMDLD